MKKSVEKNQKMREKFLWVVIVLLMLGAVFANQRFHEIALPLRLSGWILVLILGVGLALLTEKGQEGKQYAFASYYELCKVVWPGRQETVRMSMIVALFVVAMGSILWVFDSALMWITQYVTG